MLLLPLKWLPIGTFCAWDKYIHRDGIGAASQSDSHNGGGCGSGSGKPFG